MRLWRERAEVCAIFMLEGVNRGLFGINRARVREALTFKDLLDYLNFSEGQIAVSLGGQFGDDDRFQNMSMIICNRLESS
jgi:sulfur carrier protein ThiS